MSRLPYCRYVPHFDPDITLRVLQAVCEELRYAGLLLNRIGEKTEATDRMCLVAGFVISGYSAMLGRNRKPFNPLLGETFDYVADEGWRFNAEQVSRWGTVIPLCITNRCRYRIIRQFRPPMPKALVGRGFKHCRATRRPDSMARPHSRLCCRSVYGSPVARSTCGIR